MSKLAALLLLGAPAEQFDLTCAGTLTTRQYEGPSSQRYTSRFRIDLAKSAWCEGECKALHYFANVGATELTLQDDYNADLGARIQASINRETGEHNALATTGSGRWAMTLQWKGRCEKAAFSGFPVFETKF